MTPALRPSVLVLFAGDVAFFTFALWASLFLRTLEAPTEVLFLLHLRPFSLLFVGWVAVFFVAGLYESRSIILARRALSQTLLVAQTANLAIAAVFFFLTSSFGIAPKTLLLIYLAVSFLLILLWRAVLYPALAKRQETAIVVGEGSEIAELVHSLRNAHRAPARIAAVIEPQEGGGPAIAEAIHQHSARIVIADWSDARVAGAFPRLYRFLSQDVRFLDAIQLYEEVFGRISLRHVDNRWLARNVSRFAHALYDPLKRALDILVAVPAALLSLLLYPFIALAIKLQDGGEVLISMPRVGEGGRTFNLYKFRSMSGNDHGHYGEEGATKLRVTPVGRFLRVTRLDEIPQLWGVVRGDLSLIGPRPETPALVDIYNKEIPYYGVRHLIKPGLSGWAQLYHDNHPHHGEAVEATSEKLSYDLYYLKHRSLLLDGIIILKTLKKLVTRSGI